jgi:hypothetical protein
MIIEELNHKAQLRINAKAPLYCIDEFTGFGISSELIPTIPDIDITDQF